MTLQRTVKTHSNFKRTHLRSSPIFVDECCRGLFYSLKDMGLAVYKLQRGLPDEKVKNILETMRAYILTSDKEFNDYENALYVHPSTNPQTVYNMLKTLTDCEIKAKENILISLRAHQF